MEGPRLYRRAPAPRTDTVDLPVEGVRSREGCVGGEDSGLSSTPSTRQKSVVLACFFSLTATALLAEAPVVDRLVHDERRAALLPLADLALRRRLHGRRRFLSRRLPLVEVLLEVAFVDSNAPAALAEPEARPTLPARPSSPRSLLRFIRVQHLTRGDLLLQLRLLALDLNIERGYRATLRINCP